MESGKLKILIVTGIYPPDVGGPAVYVERLRRELKKLGHKVTVVTYGDERSKKTEAEGENIFSIDRGQNIISRYLNFFLECWKIAKSVDVIYAMDLVYTGLPAGWAAWIWRKPLFVRVGGDFLWERAIEFGYTDLPLKRYYRGKKTGESKRWLWLMGVTIGMANKIVLTTPWLIDLYIKEYKAPREKLTVIENPFLELRKRGDSITRNNKNILFAGRIARVKNLERLLKAIDKIPEAKLTLIGEGSERAKLEKLADELGIENRVKFRDKLPQDKLLEEYKKYRLVVVPSIYEVSPNTVLECISLGQAVLVTKECGYYDRFRNALEFFDPMDLDDLKEKLIKLFDDDYYNEYLERLGRIDVEYDWRKVGEEHEKIFLNL